MSDTTKARVLATAPNLSTISDASFSIALEDAKLEVDFGIYAELEEVAQRYYVAHVLTIAQRDGNGEIFHQKVGDVEIRFHPYEIMGKKRFDETAYGRMFVRLSRKRIVLVDYITTTTV